MEDSVFQYLPPDVLRLLLLKYLPRWAQLICRMTCVAFRNIVPPYVHTHEYYTLLGMLFFEHGELPLVKWAVSRGARLCQLDHSRYITKHTSVPLLEWVAEEYGFRFDAYDCRIAAKLGNLSALKWLHSRRNIFCKDHACMGASRGGDLEVTKWLVTTLQVDCTNMPQFLSNLASYGHLHVLRWLHGAGLFTKGDEFELIAREAIALGCVKVLDWAVAEAGPDLLQKENRGLVFLRTAMDCGQLDVVKYLCVEKHTPLGDGFPSNWQITAARWGYMELAKWLYERGYPWDETCCFLAARSGHYELVRWQRENGAPWGNNPIVAVFILESRDEEFITWARADGCPGL